MELCCFVASYAPLLYDVVTTSPQAKLTEDISELTKAVAELDAAMAKATKLRQERGATVWSTVSGEYASLLSDYPDTITSFHRVYRTEHIESTRHHSIAVPAGDQSFE